MEREKLRSHEDTLRLNAEKGRLDRTLTGAELDLAEAQQQIQHLEVIPAPTPPAWSPVPFPCRPQEVLWVRGCLWLRQQGSLEPLGLSSLGDGAGLSPWWKENIEAHWRSSLWFLCAVDVWKPR